MWLPSSTITSSITMELTILTLFPSLQVVPMMDRLTLHLSPRTLPLPTTQPADTVALLPSCTDSCTKFSKRLLGFSMGRHEARSKDVRSLHSTKAVRLCTLGEGNCLQVFNVTHSPPSHNLTKFAQRNPLSFGTLGRAQCLETLLTLQCTVPQTLHSLHSTQCLEAQHNAKDMQLQRLVSQRMERTETSTP